MRENENKYPCVYSPVPPYEVISTPWLSYEELKEIHFTEIALDKLYNSSKFNTTLDDNWTFYKDHDDGYSYKNDAINQSKIR